jgi:hypothetical protein
MLQPNFFVLFFLAMCILLMDKGKMFWAGVFLAMVIHCREYLAVSVLFFIWKKNWRFLSGVILGTIFLKALAICLFGWEIELAYWRFNAAMFGKQVHTSMHNVAFLPALFRIGTGLLGKAACAVAGLLGVGFFIINAFYQTRRKNSDLFLGFYLFLLLSFIVSPWVHEYHFLVLYPALIMFWFKLEEKNKTSLYLIFILGYLLVGLKYSVIRFPQFHLGLPAIFTAGKILGIFAFYYLTVKLLNSKQLLEKNKKGGI